MVGIITLLAAGAFLLARADGQARDTIRKHHLADLEQALFFAREVHGTFPPYEAASWCGLLNDPKNSHVTTEVEKVLRQQNNKYANPDKPFPEDPLADRAPWERSDSTGYFYWKRSPAVFELYAILEQADTNEKNTLRCPTAPPRYYDYGITSRWREDLPNLTS